MLFELPCGPRGSLQGSVRSETNNNQRYYAEDRTFELLRTCPTTQQAVKEYPCKDASDKKSNNISRWD